MGYPLLYYTFAWFMNDPCFKLISLLSVFDFTVDFSKSAFGCEEPLKLTKFWQDSSFDLQDILKVNFHDEVMDDPNKTTETLSIKGPFLFYLQSKEIPALIHLFGRVKSN